MPPAARLSDLVFCPILKVPGPIASGGSTVKIGYLPAARIGDSVVCPASQDKIVSGSATVKIDGAPAARIGDSTAHGGKVIAGLPTVSIG